MTTVTQKGRLRNSADAKRRPHPLRYERQFSPKASPVTEGLKFVVLSGTRRPTSRTWKEVSPTSLRFLSSECLQFVKSAGTGHVGLPVVKQRVLLTAAIMKARPCAPDAKSRSSTVGSTCFGP